MISPEFEYDVSIVGIFLGMGLALTLLVNNIRRGTSVMQATRAAFTTILTAAQSLKGASTASSSLAAVVAAEASPHTSTTSHTSTEPVTYVFTERA
jgi:hypothetical protein